MTYKMLKQIAKMAVLAVLAISFTRCNTFEDPYMPIEGNIKLSLFEQLDSIERKIFLVIESEREYDCENYLFEFETQVTGSKLTIDLQRIYKPNVCYSGRGPATATFNLTGLADSIYDLEIKLPNFSREGYVQKFSDKYRLEMSGTAPVLIPVNEIQRVPENVIWGMLEYNNPMSVAYVDTFYMYLHDFGAKENTYANGEYNFFQVYDSAIVNPGSDDYKFSSAFLMDFNGDFAEVANLANYIFVRSGDVQVRVITDKPLYHSTR